MSESERSPREANGARGVSLKTAGLLTATLMVGGACQAPPQLREPVARHDFRYPSRYVEVLGSRMHYVEVGTGAPIVLIHGQPTWSYLWRNVIPHLEGSGRVIAVDLIGFGKSDRPLIEYRLEDHVAHFRGFLEALDLQEITFVMHDWGSFLGFHYAADHPENVEALVFMEAVLPPDFFRPLPEAPHFEGALAFFEAAAVLSDPAQESQASRLVLEENFWIERVLPRNVLRELRPDELAAYREPFEDPADRYAMLRLPRGLRSRYGLQQVLRYSEFLGLPDPPKLAFAVEPGVTAPARSVEWLRANVANLTLIHLGEGLHYLQEDYPDQIGLLTAAWLQSHQGNLVP